MSGGIYSQLRERDEEHGYHWIGPQFCPGQPVSCRNCDDVRCMGCVFREYYHTCVDDCPDCCAEEICDDRV